MLLPLPLSPISAGNRTVNSVNSPTRLSTVDRAAMLLGHDVVADREAEAGALAGRLGGEKRLEQFVPDLGRNAAAIVVDMDFEAMRATRDSVDDVGVRAPRTTLSRVAE